MLSSDVELTEKIPSTLEIVAMLVAAVPFFIHFETVATVTAGGHTTVTYRDWVAIACGALALVAAALTLNAWRRTDPARRGRRLAVLAVIAALGVVQLVRGVGLFA